MFRATLLVALAFLLTAMASPPDSLAPATGTLRVGVDNLRQAGGTIWVGVYTSTEDFLDRNKARLVAVRVVTKNKCYVDIPDLEVGEDYALAIFHDEDDNGEFDTNFLGLPSEPWAFSGTLRSRFRLPKFEEVSFVFSPETARQDVRLRVWF